MTPRRPRAVRQAPSMERQARSEERRAYSDRAARPAFTLIEVVLAMGLAFLVLSALYQVSTMQARFARQAAEDVRRPLLARTLLHRMAREIRSTLSPRGAANAPRTQALLALNLLPEQAKAAEPMGFIEPTLDLSAPVAVTTMLTSDLPPTVEIERFAILGTSNGIAILARNSPMDDVLPLVADKTSANDADRKDVPRISSCDQRPVLYLLRPLPYSRDKEERKLEPADQPESETTADGANVDEPIPRFGGILRQEILLPFTPGAMSEAKAQLEAQLPKLEGSNPDAEVKERVFNRSMVDTRLIAEEVSSLKLRYHDGTRWQTSWTDPARLPIAIEISLSFDPRAADPLWAESPSMTSGETSIEPIAPMTPTATGDSAIANPLRADGETGETEPLYPYRLLIALPQSDRFSEPRGARNEIPPSIPPSAPMSPLDEGPPP